MKITKHDLTALDFSSQGIDESWSNLSAETLKNLDHSNTSTDDKGRNSIEDDSSIPSTNKKNAFKKSFDSAASMVFQSRNGLPLTSSPAPIRRGINFDFDSGINTPKDIKRALFEAQSPEESECGSPKKKKSDPRRLLSTSAPASISGNNLLGSRFFFFRDPHSDSSGLRASKRALLISFGVLMPESKSNLIPLLIGAGDEVKGSPFLL